MNNKEFIYEIKDKNVDDTERFILKGNIDINEIEDLIFYLQYEFHKLLDEVTLIPYDIENILYKFYAFKQLDEVNESEINKILDLSDNLDANFNKESLNRILGKKDKFYKEGLIDELQEIVIEVVYNNPTVFNKKFKEFSIEKDGIMYYPVPKRMIEEVQEAEVNNID